MEKLPKYSIIIINTNGLVQTIKCIESIFKCTSDFEIIVVDNDSNDGSRGYLDAMLKKHDNVIVIETDKKYTFAENNNFAIPKARGEYIIFLNNDTVVSTDWLERMQKHFNNVPLANIAAVGPVSSNSNGRQMVGMQDPDAYYAENNGKWSSTGILYGWCMMFKKEVIDKIGGFDERFINGHEDNDLSLRVITAGYRMVIAHDVWIFHEGQATLRKEYDQKAYVDNGYKNRELYFDKWYDPTPKKLVAVYRTNFGEHFEESLRQTSKFADHIIIHFCRTKMENRDLAVKALQQTFPKICKVGFYDGIFQEDYERNWLLQEALALQVCGEADWCISIDDDEIYEDKFIDRVKQMMNPRNPEVMAYVCNWRTIWKKELGIEYYRADSTFGQFMNYRFFRLIPGQEINSHGHPEGHHCGSAPYFPPEFITWSAIRVKHLGYDTPEQRQKKYEFYEANDHFKSRADIGNDDYSHLIDKTVAYQVYDPDLTLSFVTMIKNEEDDILACLEQFLNVVDEYIIVDTGSTDKTLDIIKKFSEHCPVPVKIFQYPWEDNYSTPRNFGKSKATGKWIIRMDADERLAPGDFKRLFSITESDWEFSTLHVLNYIEDPRQVKNAKYLSTESLRLYRNIPELFYTGIVHETLDDSIVWLKGKRSVKGERAAFPLHHFGYLKTKTQVKDKIDYYEKLNNRQIEVTEKTDARPFFNLALHYLNTDQDGEALKMLQTAIKVEPRMWHAHRQLAAMNVKSAKKFLTNVLEWIPSEHPFVGECRKMIAVMEKFPIGTVKVT